MTSFPRLAALVLVAGIVTVTPAASEPRTGWTLHALFMTRSPAGLMRPLMMQSKAPLASEEECARKAMQLRERLPISVVAMNDGSVVVAVRFRFVPEGRPS